MGVNNADYDDDGEVDYANQTIEDTSGYSNMQEFTVKAEPSSCPADKATAVLKLTDSADKDHIRVFDQNDTAVIGPDKGATYELPHSDWGSSGKTYHMEAISPRKTVHLELAVRNLHGQCIYSDMLRITTVRIRPMKGISIGSVMLSELHTVRADDGNDTNHFILPVGNVSTKRPAFIAFQGRSWGALYFSEGDPETPSQSDRCIRYSDVGRTQAFGRFVQRIPEQFLQNKKPEDVSEDQWNRRTLKKQTKYRWVKRYIDRSLDLENAQKQPEVWLTPLVKKPRRYSLFITGSGAGQKNATKAGKVTVTNITTEIKAKDPAPDTGELELVEDEQEVAPGVRLKTGKTKLRFRFNSSEFADSQKQEVL